MPGRTRELATHESEPRPFWEITAIRDPSAFMRFVVDRVPNSASWKLWGLASAKGVSALREVGGATARGGRWNRRYEIVLDGACRRRLASWWASVEWGREPIEQSMTVGEDVWFEAFDGLSPCLIWKRFSYEDLLAASMTIGFAIDEDVSHR